MSSAFPTQMSRSVQPNRRLSQEYLSYLPLSQYTSVPGVWLYRLYLVFTGFGIWNLCIFVNITIHWCSFYPSPKKTETRILPLGHGCFPTPTCSWSSFAPGPPLNKWPEDHWYEVKEQQIPMRNPRWLQRQDVKLGKSLTHTRYSHWKMNEHLHG